VTGQEQDRLDVLEAKVDRILTLLDDPDFGIRSKLKEHEYEITALKARVYTVLAAVGTALLVGAGAIVKGVFN